MRTSIRSAALSLFAATFVPTAVTAAPAAGDADAPGEVGGPEPGANPELPPPPSAGPMAEQEDAKVVVPTEKELGAPLYPGADFIEAVNEPERIFSVKLFVDAPYTKVKGFYEKKTKKAFKKVKIRGSETEAIVLKAGGPEDDAPFNFVALEKRDPKGNSCYVTIERKPEPPKAGAPKKGAK